MDDHQLIQLNFDEIVDSYPKEIAEVILFLYHTTHIHSMT